MKKTAVISMFGFMLFCSIALMSFSTIENALFEPMLDKLKKYKKDIASEEVYIHTDKTLYKQGESLWFSVYLLDANKNRLSEISDIVYVEILNPKGVNQRTYTIITKNGKANGDFTFPENCEGGIYKIKAYTRWNKQFGDKCIFSKDIQVQATLKPRLLMSLDFIRKAYGPGDKAQATFKATTLQNEPLGNKKLSFNAYIDGKKIITQNISTNDEGKTLISFKIPQNIESEDGLLNVLVEHEGYTESISRQIPITLAENIRLAFYPESGDLLENVKSNLAFKATNKYNKPVDIEGYIVDGEGKRITAFKSFHDGMGACSFKPEQDVEYHAEITKPSNVSKQFAIPAAKKSGFLFITEKKENMLDVRIFSTKNEKAFMIVHAKENNYGYEEFDLDIGWNVLSIPTNSYPAGVVYLTLFDKNANEQCERLVYINNNKQLNIAIESDKKEYLPREKVELKITAKNEKQEPVKANISLAVVNDKTISLADDKQDNILSYFLLSSDVSGEIHEPNYYFNPEEPDAEKAIDYLLLTQGWRRFTWKEVKTYNHNNTTLESPEKAEITGTILGTDLKNVKIKIEETGETVETNKYGHFTFPKVDLTHPKNLIVYFPSGVHRKIIVDHYKEYTIAPFVEGKIVLEDKDFTVEQVEIGVYGSDKIVHPDSRGNFKLKDIPNDAMMFYVRINGNETSYFIDEYFDKEIHISPYMLYKNAIPEAQPMAAGGVRNPNFQLRALKNDMIDEKEMILDNDMEVEEVLEENALFDEVVLDIDLHDKKEYAKPQHSTVYYRARVYPVPNYSENQNPKVRTDFRETIYWNATVETNSEGIATVEFYNSDEVTVFRAIAEGISNNGLIGRKEYTYHTQKAITIDGKLPEFLCYEDKAVFSILIKNNTSKKIAGTLKANFPQSLEAKQNEYEVTLHSESFTIVDIPVTVLNIEGDCKMSFNFSAGENSDAFSHSVKIFPKGFPASLSFSGKNASNEYAFSIQEPIDGSIEAKVKAYPNILADLMSGMESIFREPYGCFEQTSSSTYPNILALEFMNENNMAEPAIAKKAYDYIDRGYNKLIAYETSENGYEWFGSVPPHEGLSAYGLLEFHDMKNVYEHVDEEMVKRTQDWLMSRRNGKGDFVVDKKALDDFGRANIHVNNAYILYSLSESGASQFEKEYTKAYEEALSSKDAYRLSLMANTALNLNKKSDAKQLFDELDKILTNKKIGEFPIEHTITVSYGKSAQVETASIMLMAFLKNGSHLNHQMSLAEYIIGSRDTYSGFGSTQATVLALRALTEFSKKQTANSKEGTMKVMCNDQAYGEIAYSSEKNEDPQVDGLEKNFVKGQNTVSILFDNEEMTIPHTLSITYNTYTPENSEECNVDLQTSMSLQNCKVGETVRTVAEITNKHDATLPMVIAKVGIPSGLAPQPWQLKKLQEEGAFSYYEIINNYLVFYFTHFSPEEKKTINLDLKAEIKGSYTGPASSAYLYYTNEDKIWNKGLNITIQ